MTKRFTALIREESGQSLVMVAVSITTIVVLAAFAVDVANWFATRHKAQVTADAMALAAANYMATNYSSANAVSNATSLGQSSRYTNGSGVQPSSATISVDTTNYKVTATVTTSGSNQFAAVAGIGPPTIKATAVASYASGPTPYALFADGGCGSGNISFSGNGNNSTSEGNDNFTGGIHSNGDLSGGVGNNSTLGAISYGCQDNFTVGNGSNISTGPVLQGSNSLSWPVPYDSTTCTLPGSNTNCYFNPATACTYTASGTVPASLSGSVTSTANTRGGYDLNITGSVGTSASPVVICDPNGQITVSGNQYSIYGTLYGSGITSSGNNVGFYPPPNFLVIYDCDTTGTYPVTLGGNSLLEGGYVYAPHDTVYMSGNDGSGFVEAQSIAISGNTWQFTGTGPTYVGAYGDTLVQ